MEISVLGGEFLETAAHLFNDTLYYGTFQFMVIVRLQQMLPPAISRLGTEAWSLCHLRLDTQQVKYNPQNTLPTSAWEPSYRAYTFRALEATVFWKRELLSWKNFS
jgi:hypothetical protein